MSGDPLATRRKRLLYRSKHRGTKEADLLLGGFAESHLWTMDETALDSFEALLSLPDSVLVDWVTGRSQPAEGYRTPVTELLVSFKPKTAII
ncbi:MAG: succinate dehydrogenase assembly factor 2 [Kiloniellales bacterium]